MSENKNDTLTTVSKNEPKPTFNKAVSFAIATGVTTFLPATAMAGELDSVGATLTAEIDSSKAIVIGLFGAAALILAIFAGWRYMKRGANSA